MTKRKILRVPKNPRKFKIWDSDHLNKVAQKAAQIVYNIEQLSEEEGTYIHELPSTQLPTHLVYEVCEAYVAMYQKLLKEQLLITGNPDTHPHLH